MTRTARTLVAALLLSAIVAGCSEEQPGSDLRADLDELRGRIAEAEQSAARHQSGLTGEMAAMRLEALRLTAALLENRLVAMQGGVPVKMVAPASAPDLARARQILRHIEAAEAQHAEARKKAEKQTRAPGSVAGSLAETTVVTQELALAQLWLAYYQSVYGLALPGRTVAAAAGGGGPAPADPARVLEALAAAPDGEAAAETAKHAIAAPPAVPAADSPAADAPEEAGTPEKAQAFAPGAGEDAIEAFAAKPLPTKPLPTKREADDVTSLIERVKSIDQPRTDAPQKAAPVAAPQPIAEPQPAQSPRRYHSREQTIRIQLMLQEAGFNPGSVDGRWGPSTEEALARFQRAAGLPADGRPDSRTLDALGLQ